VVIVVVGRLGLVCDSHVLLWHDCVWVKIGSLSLLVVLVVLVVVVVVVVAVVACVVLVAGAAGQQDDRHLPRRIEGPELRAAVDALGAGRAHVQQDQVRMHPEHAES
jgi:nitrogen fixation-related uncharacterized protein